MADNKKESPTIPDYIKTVLGIPSYGETPRKPEISYDPQSFMMELSFDGNLSKIAEQFTDSDFFDSETGRKMIEADGALRESSPIEFQSENPNSPGCSSWVPCTTKKVKDIPRLLYDVKNQESNVKISQYIKARSESLGDDSLLTIFEPDSSATSTPMKKRKSLLSCDLEAPTKNKLDFSNVTLRENSFQSFNISNKNDSFFSIGNTPKKLKYTTPIMEKYQQYIGSSNYKQIKRLEAEQAGKNALSIDESPMNSLRFEEDRTLEQSMSEWLLQPNQVQIDSLKGARVLLINKSDKTIRFTSSCNSKIANICPLCGVIPARNQIGLRIVISHQLRKCLENVEEEVKISVGNEVKTITLRIVNEQKEKNVPKRKFITY